MFPPIDSVEIQPYIPHKTGGYYKTRTISSGCSKIMRHDNVIWIQLNENKWTKTNFEFFESIKNIKWSYKIKNGKEYAVSKIDGHATRFHRLVLQNVEVIDHIDGNGLNNLIENLRRCTTQQNLYNRPKTKVNTSGYKGVSRHKNKWRAKIKINGKLIHLGIFETPDKASFAYENAAKKHHKEFYYISQ